jgi:hypothetical protein
MLTKSLPARLTLLRRYQAQVLQLVPAITVEEQVMELLCPLREAETQTDQQKT